MMSRATVLSLIVIVLGATIAGATHSARTLTGNTWSIQYDDPPKDGTVTTTIEIEYIDALGKKQTKTITASTNIQAAQNSNQKRDAVKQKIDDELAKTDNKVNGNALASTGGSGDATTVSPAGDSQGNFTDAKIKKVTVDDSKTNEKDKVTPPAGVRGMAQISLVGDIVGTDDAGATSSVTVTTSIGNVTVSTPAGSRRIDVLRQLSSGLVGQGADVWLDTSALTLYVTTSDQGVTSIGATSSDSGLTTRCALLGQR